MSHLRRCIFLLMTIGSLLAAGMTFACEETVMIADHSHSVGNQWCGKKLDPSFRADPNRLARLPEPLTYKDLGIYLLRPVRDAWVRMADAASEENVVFHVNSGYRSARYQEEIIVRRLNEGKPFKEIIRFIAPPGYSEHESGRAVDLTSSQSPFHVSEAYSWLKQNAARFGFRESYPKDDPSPIPWEPWHWYFSGPQDP